MITEYARPDRADDYTPSTPTAAAPTGLAGTAVEQAEAAIGHAVKAHGNYLQQLEQDKDRYSQTGYAQQAALFGDTAAAKAVDTALAQVETVATQAQTEVDNIRAGFIQHGDAAQESRAMRYWNRSRGLLDAADHGGRFAEAEKLLNKADRNELSVLAEELPAYLQATIGPMSDQTKHSLGLGPSTDWGDWIDAVHMPRVVPEYGAAKTRLANAQKALAVTKHSANSLKQSIANGVPFGRPIPTAAAYDTQR